MTGANGLASSRQLPLGRYTIRETKAPANYGASGETYIRAYLLTALYNAPATINSSSLTSGM